MRTLLHHEVLLAAVAMQFLTRWPIRLPVRPTSEGADCAGGSWDERWLGQCVRHFPAVGGLIAAVEIDCELLGVDGWQIEGKRRSVDHGCGVPLRRKHARLSTVCYAISTAYGTATALFFKPDA